jgi:hypothetical protein
VGGGGTDLSCLLLAPALLGVGAESIVGIVSFLETWHVIVAIVAVDRGGDVLLQLGHVI